MKIQAQYVWHESTLLIIIILSHKSRDIGKLFCVLNIKNWKSQVPSKDIYIDIYICVCICLHVCAQIKYVYSCICKWKLEVNVRCCLPIFPISFFSDRYSHWNWISPMWLSGWLSNFCGLLSPHPSTGIISMAVNSQHFHMNTMNLKSGPQPSVVTAPIFTCVLLWISSMWVECGFSLIHRSLRWWYGEWKPIYRDCVCLHWVPPA